MEDNKSNFYGALVEISRRLVYIYNAEHPKFRIFEHEDYTVITNSDMMQECRTFIYGNIELIDDIFPKQFKCFKLDENLTAKLVLISENCKENYQISCATKFDFIENKLYAIKSLSCNKPDGLGFVIMKYDLIEDDAALGRFMHMNQDTNYFLTKFGGICDARDNPHSLEILSGYGKHGAITFTNRIFGMFDPEASNAYGTDEEPNEWYVEMGNYKMVQFDTIDSVKKCVGTDRTKNCTYINYCSIELVSKHLRINKWINKIFHPNFKFSYKYIDKQQKA